MNSVQIPNFRNFQNCQFSGGYTHPISNPRVYNPDYSHILN